MTDTRYEIYLGALLHDIGKFYQRADKGSTNNSDYLKTQILNLESVYCPQYKGIYSHKHVLWTAQFFDDFEKVFQKLASDTGLEGNNFLRMSSMHHNPDSIGEKIIQLADHYSSGIDRVEDKNEISLLNQKKWDSFKKLRMCSIFESLLLETEEDFEYTYALPIKEIDFSEDYFPKKTSEFPDTPEKQYKSLWEDFITQFKFIQTSDLKAFSDTLLHLLYKFTANVPGSTIHLRDVSLFDHLKSTAAFSLCLYDFLQEKNGLKEVVIDKKEKPILLVGADISGIQNFIYDIVSKNAAKNLKGRSFYLQLLVDNILKFFLDELKLTEANIIYGSGGGFYLLATNTKFVKNKLKDIEKAVTDKLFAKHKLSLFLAIDAIEISQEEIYDKSIHIPWRTLTEKLNTKKRCRFSSKLVEQYDYFFTENEVGGKQKRDAITNEEFDIDEESEGVEINEKDNKSENLIREYVKKSTYDQIRLGKVLKNTKYWILSKNQLDIDKEYEFTICDLGYFNYFLDEVIFKRITSILKNSKSEIEINKFNNTDFIIPDLSVNKISLGFTFYGGNDFPIDNVSGAIKTFDHLAEESEDTKFKRLGVLRMDVDNLGHAFIKGFSDTRRTFSRYSALSRNLDYFFRGYLNHIWESRSEYKLYTYIVYSGGDDLFIVGKWNLIIEMAEKIKEDFTNWTCMNPKLGLSGGVAIVTAKFPIVKAAKIAEKFEKKAKGYELELKDKKVIEKNAFTIMDYSLNWDNEFPIVKELKNELKDFIDTKAISKGLLNKIRSFAYAHEKNPRNYRWRWMMAYDFTRFLQNKRNAVVKNFLDQVRNDSFSDAYKGANIKEKSIYHYLILLNIAARWAELELRS